MKLVSFSVATVFGETVRVGALVEDSIVDLNLAYAGYLTESGTTGRPYEVANGIMPPDMVEFFKGGELSRDSAGQVINFVRDRLDKRQPINGPKGEKIVHQPEEVKLLAPVPRPNSIRDTLSFEGHMKNFEKRNKKPIPELWY